LSGIEIEAIEAWLRHDRDCDCVEILQIVTRQPQPQLSSRDLIAINILFLQFFSPPTLAVAVIATVIVLKSCGNDPQPTQSSRELLEGRNIIVVQLF
jgi:hypothetical protein